ncbi:MAG: hypothetical protein WCR27_04115 [Eubacteriales bacterium]
MRPYIIEKSSKKPYSALVIGISSESFYSYLYDLEKDLQDENFEGKILIYLIHNLFIKEVPT